jgi:hypothetical protein
MKNSNVPVKSKGVILFAFNTDVVDYVAIAEQAARLVHHTLNLPVTLVTDHGAVTAHFDQTIVVENTVDNYRTGYASGTLWRNGNRYQAYELSPYDETILIDSDYLMLDRSLLTALDTTLDYRLIYDNRSPNEWMTGNMGGLTINYVWATAITFKKTSRAKMLFDLVGRIQRNYSYYRKLYQVREHNFRNDYAFAMANNMLNGYTPNQSQGLPWTMLTLDKPISKLEIKQQSLIVREQEKAHIVPRQNIHVMDKAYLLSDNHVKFVDAICQE